MVLSKQTNRASSSRGSTASAGFVFGPSQTAINFAGGARCSVPPFDQDIVVIDNFWHDAARLRSMALASTFVARHSESGFTFHECMADRRHATRVADLVSRACGEALLDSYFESRFVYETAADEALTRERVWVHYDRWERVGVLYLANAPNMTGGTGFYRHRPTGFVSVHEADAAGMRGDVMADSTNMDAWELIHSVPIVFNRMIVFRPHYFHQAICYFGSTPPDARLYNVLAFDALQENRA